MILVIGDINVDVMAPLLAPLAIGEDCPSRSLAFHCGGVGVNVAAALAALGSPVRLVGCTGRDWFGDHVLAQLGSLGIEVSRVRKVDGVLTGMMFIAVSPDGQRTIFGSRGANVEPPVYEETCLEGVKAVEVAGYAFLNPATAGFADSLLQQAKKRTIWTTIDVGSAPSLQNPAALLQAVGKVNTVFANANEAHLITAQTELDGAFACLEESGCEVVLKLGQQGCQLRIDGRVTAVPPFQVKAVDTTGAGDSFTAAFMASRLWGWSAAESALFANAAGAAATTVMGAGENMLGTAEIERMLEAAKIKSDWEPVLCDVIRRLATRKMDKARTKSEGA